MALSIVDKQKSHDLRGGIWTDKGYANFFGDIGANKMNCYEVEFVHYLGHDPGFEKNAKRHILPLNGSGKNKAEGKIEGYLRSFYK